MGRVVFAKNKQQLFYVDKIQKYNIVKRWKRKENFEFGSGTAP